MDAGFSAVTATGSPGLGSGVKKRRMRLMSPMHLVYAAVVGTLCGLQCFSALIGNLSGIRLVRTILLRPDVEKVPGASVVSQHYVEKAVIAPNMARILE